MKRVGPVFVAIVIGLVITVGQSWLSDSYTVDRKRARVSSTYSRDYWFLYRPDITLSDLVHERKRPVVTSIDAVSVRSGFASSAWE